MIPTESSHPPEMDALRWAVRPGMYRPDYRRSLTNIFPTLLQLLGAAPDGNARPDEDAGPSPGLSHCLPDNVPRDAQRVLLVCLDAFGFKELSQSRRFQALYPNYGTWITSVFPSITSCALTSLYQGLPPARHGITGHVIWKDFPGAVVDMLKMRVMGAEASLLASGFDVNLWKREPGILDAPAASRDWAGYQLLHRNIMGSGLSNYIYGSTSLVDFFDPLEGFAKARGILNDMERGWVGIYTDEVDMLSHVLTGDAPQVGMAVRRIEEALAWLAGALPSHMAESTVMMVVADHGQSSIREKIPLYGKPHFWLEAHTRAVGNSGRVLHLYLDGTQEDRVRKWLEEHIAGRGQVFSFEEIKHLTGPPLEDGGILEPGQEDWVRRSLGDLVAVLDDGYNWEKRDPAKGGGPYDSRLVSQHGALSWDEMFVPLICAPLTAMGEGG